MKITIECESAFEARCCMRAQDMLAVLRDLDEAMRKTVKYEAIPYAKPGSYNYNSGVVAATEHWRGLLFDTCADRGIDLEDDEVAE